MAKVKSSQVFKQNYQQQAFLLPPDLGEMIAAGHLVRVVNQLVDSMDLTGLLNLYQGGGTSAYHPRMMLKVLLYAYSVKIYTGRKIAAALRNNIEFLWISGRSNPDFRTINNFRSSKAKEVIEVLFQEMLKFLATQQYIKLENYFCDGSTFRANANQHKMVWKKNSARYLKGVEENCQELFKQIEELNASEDKQYGARDLEENGTGTPISKEAINEQITTLNDKLNTTVDGKEKRKAAGLKKKLEEESAKITSYEKQIKTSGNRSGYNKTDTDASAMRMKNKVEVLPAYNVLAGCEDQFITGVTVHQNPNDGTCLEDHLRQVIQVQPQQPKTIIADAGFGTEQNYEMLEKKDMESFVKFPSFGAEQKKSYKDDIFHKDHFSYDSLTDTYQCPDNRKLVLKRSFKSEVKRDGYQADLKEYTCESCHGCPFQKQCCNSDNEKDRSITVSRKLEKYKQEARQKLNSEEGIRLRKQRSVEIESCFGDIKHNMEFRRFHLRGLRKVKTEISLVAMAHNMRKVCLKMNQNAN